MELSFSNADITLTGGVYYTPPFVVEKNDSLMTVQVTLSGSGTASFQSSIDGTTYFDVANTTITCAPAGLESFAECQYGLFYRLKSSTSITSVKILV